MRVILYIFIFCYPVLRSFLGEPDSFDKQGPLIVTCIEKSIKCRH